MTRIIAGPEFVSAALFGLGLSYGLTSNRGMRPEQFKDTPEYDKLMEVARGLAHKQGGHNKFLETITLALDVEEPRYWWQEFDTYRVGVTKQSESTIHTLMKYGFSDHYFADDLFDGRLVEKLNEIHDKYLQAKAEGDEEKAERCFMYAKRALPEGYLQRRIVCLNAKTLQNMYNQRKDHRLPEWHRFFDDISAQLKERAQSDKECGFVHECLFG